MSRAEGEEQLSPQPEPTIEPPEPPPGGPDAIDPVDEALPADLDPDLNASAPDVPELRTGEDTSTEATKDGEDVDPEDEAPA
jgi:hypothetical protein